MVDHFQPYEELRVIVAEHICRREGHAKLNLSGTDLASFGPNTVAMADRLLAEALEFAPVVVQLRKVAATAPCNFADAEVLGAEATADYCYAHQAFCEGHDFVSPGGPNAGWCWVHKAFCKGEPTSETMSHAAFIEALGGVEVASGLSTQEAADLYVQRQACIRAGEDPDDPEVFAKYVAERCGRCDLASLTLEPAPALEGGVTAAPWCPACLADYEAMAQP